MSTITRMVRKGIRRFAGEDGQATVEYTLVGMCAAGLASALLAWVNKTPLLGGFFGAVVKHIRGLIG